MAQAIEICERKQKTTLLLALLIKSTRDGLDQRSLALRALWALTSDVQERKVDAVSRVTEALGVEVRYGVHRRVSLTV